MITIESLAIYLGNYSSVYCHQLCSSNKANGLGTIRPRTVRPTDCSSHYRIKCLV